MLKRKYWKGDVIYIPVEVLEQKGDVVEATRCGQSYLVAEREIYKVVHRTLAVGDKVWYPHNLSDPAEGHSLGEIVYHRDNASLVLKENDEAEWFQDYDLMREQEGQSNVQ